MFISSLSRFAPSRSSRLLAKVWVGATLGLTLAAAGCTTTDGTEVDGGAEPEGPVCTQAQALACEDELVAALQLQDGAVSPKGVINREEDGFIHVDVDATAGGLVADPRQSFLYARFTPSGLEKVDVNDIEALSSMDWDIAFHRYIIRLNGGSSGPSCVSAAPSGETFEDASATSVTSTTFDDQFNAECVFRATEQAEDPDNEQDFGVVLAGYYDYVGCLSMTGETFIIQLPSRERIKLEVTHYYDDQSQQECNELGSTIPIGAAKLQLRYAYVED